MSRGQLIKKFRKRRNLTQEQLATKAELATITIRQYESEKRVPQTEQLLKIARALDVPISELWGEDNGDFLFNDKLANFIVSFKNAIVFVREGEIESLHGTCDNDNISVEQMQYITSCFYDLNHAGRQEAIKRIKELVRLEEYSIHSTPDPLPEDQEGNSSTPQEKPPEGQ